MRLLAALLAAAALSTSTALAEDDGSKVSDPAMKEALENAEASNIESAIDRAGKELARDLEFVVALGKAAKSHADEAVGTLKGAKAAAGDDDAETLSMSTQLLEKKLAALPKAAAAAGVPFPDGKQRPSYRPADRVRDLKHAEGLLAAVAAKRKTALPGLPKARAEFVAALRGAAGEVRHAAQAASLVLAKKNLAALKDPAKQLHADVDNLGREIRLCEIALILQRIEEEAWQR
ncbi:MAG: hypothetical protein HY078_03460 [Elusimicrobia bacterium]|nr:hypothetical protein [Elusimicrobiota bacterium]